MPEDVQADVNADSSTQDAEAASSAADQQQDVQSTQQATAPTSQDGQTADVPFNKHPRWIERQQELERERREKESLREQNQQLIQMLQRPVQVASPQPQATDPWDGLVNHQNPEHARFYQTLQTVVRAERQIAKQEAISELQPVIQAGMERLAQIDIRDFRRENPDIKAGSEQERMIVSYMNGQVDGVRHPLESAKRNALFDQVAEENRTLKSKQQAIPRKAAANTESSSGIPQVSGMPRRSSTTSEVVSDILEKGGNMRDAAKAIFG